MLWTPAVPLKDERALINFLPLVHSGLNKAPHWVQSMNHPCGFPAHTLECSQDPEVASTYPNGCICVSYVHPAPWSDIKDKVYVAELSKLSKVSKRQIQIQSLFGQELQ